MHGNSYDWPLGALFTRTIDMNHMMIIMNLNCNKRIEDILNTREIFVFYNGTLCELWRTKKKHQYLTHENSNTKMRIFGWEIDLLSFKCQVSLASGRLYSLPLCQIDLTCILWLPCLLLNHNIHLHLHLHLLDPAGHLHQIIQATTYTDIFRISFGNYSLLLSNINIIKVFLFVFESVRLHVF